MTFCCGGKLAFCSDVFDVFFTMLVVIFHVSAVQLT
jgi:hypothetical protein